MLQRLCADLPVTRYRFSFDCLAKTRAQADVLALTLVSVIQWLGVGVGYESSVGVYLASAETLSVRWQPDPDSDTPRYIVDALITTVL